MGGGLGRVFGAVGGSLGGVVGSPGGAGVAECGVIIMGKRGLCGLSVTEEVNQALILEVLWWHGGLNESRVDMIPTSWANEIRMAHFLCCLTGSLRLLMVIHEIVN